MNTTNNHRYPLLLLVWATLFIVACSEEELKSITEPLRSLLKKSGGVCLVSDAQWLVH